MMQLLLAAALVLGVIPLANAQESMIVCPSQQELEQVLQSDESFIPDDCRELTITRVDSPAGSLCVMDFRARDPGMLDQLTEAAVTTQWWVSCDDLR
jgi:hypothetical protein